MAGSPLQFGLEGTEEVASARMDAGTALALLGFAHRDNREGGRQKMIRLATIAALGALLFAAPSFATDAKGSEKAAVSAAAPTVKEAPVRRRTTVERWRGAPYVRASHTDTLIRQEALDKTLPIVTHTPNLVAAPTF
jgi:hypothetical protein